jgi:hypothetical protein
MISEGDYKEFIPLLLQVVHVWVMSKPESWHPLEVKPFR